ncbi:MAG: hypothetical protein JWM82_1168, partial [Myxococcales bacterium]|nr:hypothetical protein [Myxococcales bacterium]
APLTLALSPGAPAATSSVLAFAAANATTSNATSEGDGS